MDKIEIKELEIFANHGVFPEENVLGQKFVISATLYTSTRTAGLTDDLTASIHYGEVSQMITRFVQEHTYKLLETVVENLARMLLLTLPSLQKVTLKIEKPWAPVGLPLKTVSVEITREWHTAYIALGSNLGDKQKYLDDAVYCRTGIRLSGNRALWRCRTGRILERCIKTPHTSDPGGTAGSPA